MYQQGQIVEYINAGKSQRGMIIANNKCLQYSNVFQVVPFRFGFFPALEKRDIINRNCISKMVDCLPQQYLQTILKKRSGRKQKKHPLYNIGDIVFAELPEKGEHIQSGNRPVVVVSTPTKKGFCQIVPLSTKLKKQSLPTHLVLKKGDGNLRKASVVLGEAEMLTNINNFKFRIGTLNAEQITEVKNVIDAQYSIIA